MLFLCVVLILVVPVHSNDEDKGYNALHFGTSTSDYVHFSFDMSPFRESFSLCMWVKCIYTSSSNPTVFHYYASSQEILITSNGYYTSVVGDHDLNGLTSKFTTPTGTWYSYCLTWSLSSRTSKLYLDGELVATDQTASGRALTMGGTLRLGRRIDSSSTSRVFGGQVYQFNMFSEVLSAADIKKIAVGGLCSDLEEFSETRILRWEDILYRSRSGSVTEIDTGCKQILENTRKIQQNFTEANALLSETKLKLEATEDKLEVVTSELNKTEDALETVTGRLNSTEEELETVSSKFNKSEDQLETCTSQLNRTEDKLETVSVQLNSTQEQLETIRGELRSTEDKLETETAERNKTVEQLETCSATLTDTQTELDGTRKFENITRWDVLYTAPYFNKVFTDELYEQLTSSWDILRKFVGANITEGIVDHFRHYHIERECDVFDLLSSAMLKQFVGVELTYGIIDHFRQHLEESACDNTTES